MLPCFADARRSTHTLSEWTTYLLILQQWPVYQIGSEWQQLKQRVELQNSRILSASQMARTVVRRHHYSGKRREYKSPSSRAPKQAPKFQNPSVAS